MASFNLTSSLYAQPVPAGGAPASGGTSTSTATAAKPAEAQQPAALTTLLFPVLLIVIFYFLLIRPQQKKEKNRQAMLKKLNKGDRIITRGGLIGVVGNVRDAEGIAVVKIAENTKVEVLINSIEVVNPTPEQTSEGVSKTKK